MLKKVLQNKFQQLLLQAPEKSGKTQLFGVWRSLVAHSSGGRGVASSNLVTPTNQKAWYGSTGLFLLLKSVLAQRFEQ